MKQNAQPPSLFLRFFRWFCDPAVAEDIEGDLTELFERDIETGKTTRANVKFAINTLRLFRPGIIRKTGTSTSYTHTSMFKNYFITSVRSLMRNKGFSAINIAGLAVGLATFSLIALYVHHELSFDRYHQKADRIFRIVEDIRTENEILFQSVSSPPMGPHLLKDFPEIESYVRFQNWNKVGQRGNITAFENDTFIVDSTVFDVFSFDLIKGDRKTALREPYSIVLTESVAKRYFGDEDPVGQQMKMDYDNFTVTGVVKDVPENSHFKFGSLISFSTWSKNNHEGEDSGWFWNGFHTYILLREGKSVEDLRAKMPDFIKRNIGKGDMYYENLPLQPLTEIYMSPQRSWENGTRGSMNNIYILSIIAVFILLIACFNYINLATARASKRMKEVGMRKVLGAVRRMLIAQFLGESIIISFLAGLLATAMVWGALPGFRTLVESPLDFTTLPPAWIIILSGIALVMFIGVLGGSYPALIISGFQPLQMFRPAVKGIYSHNSFRKVLVGLQFMISIMLVAGTLLVYDQLTLIRQQDLGFNKDAVLLLPTNGDTLIVRRLDAVKNELKKIVGVQALTGSSGVPGQNTSNQFTGIEMKDGKISPTNINYIFVDHDFLSTYDIKLIAGRNFSRQVQADDTTAYLINETAVKDFGWTPEDAIGKKVERRIPGKIIGVIKDFHYQSLHAQVEPLMLAMTDYANMLSVRIDKENISATVEQVHQKWSEIVPFVPFNYSFLDVDFDRQYKADQQLSKITGVFTGLAIFIGCLGLLGLTSFVVERRTKEIGVRKVLGASVSSVVMLIAQEFLWLIAIALVIATPCTWYLINQWEQNFTLQAVINPFRFVIAGGAVLTVAWLTISVMSFRAARENPTKSLRTE